MNKKPVVAFVNTQRGSENKQKVLEIYETIMRDEERVPTLREVAGVLGLTHATVRYYVGCLERENKMVVRGHRVYVGDEKSVRDQRKISTMETNEKKRAAGQRGARMARERAEKLGVSSSALSRFPAWDDDLIEARIDRIVENAKQNGTYCHPRPKYVVLIGQKAG